MKKYTILSALAILVTLQANATVWRVSNIVGANASFTTVSAAATNASVLSGDTIYIEPSTVDYGSVSLTKRLVFVGNGYLLDINNDGNPGLQENINESIVGTINLNAGSEGSRFIGITISNYIFFGTIASVANITIERCQFLGGNVIYSYTTKTVNNVTFRKCIGSYIYGQTLFSSSFTLHNFVVENCIFASNSPYTIQIEINPASTGVVIRNNTFGGLLKTNNAYVSNNIFLSSSQSILSSCVVKNNVFVVNQTGVTVGPLSTNGNNLVSQTVASLIANSGSRDSDYQLAALSPAISGGVNIGGVKPDCGAFGGNDPYSLSGIPSIPTIYSVSFPNGNSVPSGSSSIIVDFSTRNNK